MKLSLCSLSLLMLLMLMLLLVLASSSIVADASSVIRLSKQKCDEDVQKTSSLSSPIQTSESFQQRVEELRAAVGTQPLKGWNSYDCYDWVVDEAAFMANVQLVHDQLLPLGFNVVTVDFYWYLAVNGSQLYIDEYGRPQPDPTRFPSSTNGVGFKAIADTVHDLGLLFGIHVMRGISQTAITAKSPIFNGTGACTAADVADMTRVCPWDATIPGPWDFYAVNMSSSCGQAFYNSLFVQYAAWGVDFIKFDCVYGWNYVPDQIDALSAAIDNSGRPMLLSLSPGDSNHSHAEHVAPLSNIFRAMDDTWDNWNSLNQHFAIAASMQPFIGLTGRYGLGSFPDLDMLPLGWIGNVGNNQPPSHWSRLTLDEQQTMLSLWMIARSPLTMGGDLTHYEPNVMSKLTNVEAIAINNYTTNNVLLSNLTMPANIIVWRAESTQTQHVSAGGVFYLAVFNVDNNNLINVDVDVVSVVPQSMSVSMASMASVQCDVRDVWLKSDLGRFSTVSLRVDTHASYLLTLSNCA